MANSRVHGEVEFEFREGDTGSGQFLLCGKVLASMRGFLMQGEIEQAARLLAACAENVGDDLIKETLAAGASQQLLRSMAEMFFRAKDYGRAAVCAERVGNFELAAQCFEAGYDLRRAAEYYLAAKQPAKAAAAFERNRNHDRAAQLYLQLGEYIRAAENLERIPRYYEAAQLYLRLNRWEKAVEVLQRVPRDDADFPHAANYLGQLLERRGDKQRAMQWYAEVVRERPIDAQTVDVYFRLAVLCFEAGFFEQAHRLISSVLSLNPEHPAAQRLREEMARKRAETGLNIQIDVEPSEPIRALSPLTEIEQSVPRITQEHHLVGVDHDFEFLQQTSLFAELSLDELKKVHGLCDKVSLAPDQHLITEGQPAKALFVIVRGKVAIGATSPRGNELAIAVLGPGEHVGEMSLLDNAPASATVYALDGVVAFRLERTRFQELIAANERIQLRVQSAIIQTLSRRLREANRK